LVSDVKTDKCQPLSQRHQPPNLLLLLGSGSYGSVKRATRISDGLEVAVKIIPKKNVTGHFDMVLGEINVLKDIDHPNVIHFYDWFESR
jgi:calcium/calmodulin-dependent protein kinase I